jgi:hypothetical protein
MEGFLTQGVIGAIVLALVITAGMALLVDMQNNYGAVAPNSVSSTQSTYSDKNGELQRLAFEAQQRQQNASIDQTVQDFAQLQAIAQAEGQKKDAFSIFMDAMQSIREIVQYDPAVTYSIAAIIAVLVGAAATYLIIGRKP